MSICDGCDNALDDCYPDSPDGRHCSIKPERSREGVTVNLTEQFARERVISDAEQCIAELKQERDKWIAEYKECTRVHLIEKNQLCRAVRTLTAALEPFATYATKHTYLGRQGIILSDIATGQKGAIRGKHFSTILEAFKQVEGMKCGECGGTGEIINDGPYSVCDDCMGTGLSTKKETT